MLAVKKKSPGGPHMPLRVHILPPKEKICVLPDSDVKL